MSGGALLLLGAVVLFGSVWMMLSGLSTLFRSTRRDEGVHITYNIHIDRSFNERIDKRGNCKTETAHETRASDEYLPGISKRF